MKALIISENTRFLPWAADSGIKVLGLLLPEANNLLFRVEEIDGKNQLIVFPNHKPQKNFKKLVSFDIPEEKVQELVRVAQSISKTISYLHFL